jgi:hypothetical protein
LRCAGYRADLVAATLTVIEFAQQTGVQITGSATTIWNSHAFA